MSHSEIPDDILDSVASASGIILTDEQEEALEAVEAWRREPGGGFLSLTGPAGSGKSTLVNELLAAVPFGALSAMTGKAALRLRDLCGGRATTTLHSILYFPPEPGADLRFERVRAPESHAVVVDESSMMAPKVYEDLRGWVNYGTKLLLVGDAWQLPPVVSEKAEREKWGEDFSVFSQVRGPALKTVMRSVGGVLRAATKLRETERLPRESDFDGQAGYEYVECSDPMGRAVADYLEDPHMLVTWRNELRMSASRAVREQLGHGGPLPDPGEPVLIRKNGQGFLNGEVVECEGWRTGPVIGANPQKGILGLPTMWMKVVGRGEILTTVQGGGTDADDERFFDGSMPWIEDYRAWHIDLRRQEIPQPTPITWGYVLTGHAVQGSESRRVTVFLEERDLRSSNFLKMTMLPDGSQARFSARWTYTGLTRAKVRGAVVVGE